MDYSPRYKLFIIASTVFLLVGFKTFVSLGISPYANGWDSYFYLIQAKSWLVEGAMHSPSASLIHPYITFALFCGIGEDIIAYKIAIALLAGLFGLLAVLIANKWSKNTEVVLIVGSLLIITPFIDYFSAQYPKNLLGLVLFLAFVLSISNKKLIVPIILLALNFFGHKLTFGMTLIFFLFYYSSNLLKRKVIIIGLTTGVVLILCGIFIPGLLSIADTERLSGFFNSSPSWASFEFIQFLTSDHVSSWWTVVIILFDIGFILTLGWCVYCRIKKKNTSPHMLPILSLGILFLFPFMNWGEDGLALRLYLSFAMIIPLLVAFLKINIKYKLVPAAIFIISIVCTTQTIGYDYLQHDPPYNSYKKITDRLNNIEAFKSSELVIGHKSLAEYITFETGKDVLPWQPEYKIDDGKLWRIATDIIIGDLRYYLPNSSYHVLTPNYFLVKESDWQLLIQKAKNNNDHQLLKLITTWRNPHQVRPDYLLRNKRK